MTDEFKALLEASNEAHNTWMGAMGHHTAVYQHLGSVGLRASEAHLEELQAAWEQASGALNAYMNGRRQFDAAAYEAQQNTTRHLQAA